MKDAYVDHRVQTIESNPDAHLSTYNAPFEALKAQLQDDKVQALWWHSTLVSVIKSSTGINSHMARVAATSFLGYMLGVPDETFSDDEPFYPPSDLYGVSGKI